MSIPQTDEEAANQLVYAAAHGNFTDVQEMLRNAEEEADAHADAHHEIQSSSSSANPAKSGNGGSGVTQRPSSALGYRRDHLHPRVTVDVFASVGEFAGCTALMAAAQNGRTKIVEWLIDTRKADVQIKSKAGFGPVHYACKRNNNLEVLKKLLGNRADPSPGFDLVCARGDDRSLDQLLNWQTSISVIDACVKTAAKNGHGKCLLQLLKLQGYNTPIVLSEALHLACVSGKSASVSSGF